jgi:hypothetical protein
MSSVLNILRNFLRDSGCMVYMVLGNYRDLDIRASRSIPGNEWPRLCTDHNLQKYLSIEDTVVEFRPSGCKLIGNYSWNKSRSLRIVV